MSRLPIPSKRLVSALQRIEGGDLRIKARDTEILHVTAAPNTLTIDVHNTDVMKATLKPIRDLGVLPLGDGEADEGSVLDLLRAAKGVAADLKDAGMTIRVQRRGATLLVLGDGARPRLSRLVLGNHIQANLLQLLSLVRALR